MTENKRVMKVIISERAKNICGAPYGSVIENLEWLVAKTREMTLKEVGELLFKEVIDVKLTRLDRYLRVKEIAEALKQGRLDV